MRARITAVAQSLRGVTPSAAQYVGMGVFAAGGFVLAVWLGLFLTGAFLAFAGTMAERSRPGGAE